MERMIQPFVSQASAAIPVVPLYVALLFRVMKDMDLHEDCMSHIYRMFATQLCGDQPLQLDEVGRIRMDDVELREEIQEAVRQRWGEVSTENLAELGDLEGFRADFLRIFGFGIDGVDYDADVDITMGRDVGG